MLITPAYLVELKRLHAKGGFGVSSAKWAPLIAKQMGALGCTSVLDYGSGTGQLAKVLRELMPKSVAVSEYDPAIPGKDDPNRLVPCDMTVCSDVLEHIELECIDDVLNHIAFLTKRLLFAVVSTRLAENKFLSDGRNAHVLIQHGGWWKMKIEGAGFKIVDYMTKLAPPYKNNVPGEWRCIALRVKNNPRRGRR